MTAKTNIYTQEKPPRAPRQTNAFAYKIMPNQAEKENDIMSTITIHEQATATAKGIKNNKHCKPVLCIDTGEIFSSVFDAAEHFGVSACNVSQACNGKLKTSAGKRFCFVSKTSENIDAIVSRIKANDEILAKAAAYDAMIAEQQAKENEIAAVQAEMEQQQRLYLEHIAMAGEAKDKFDAAARRLAVLTGESEG